MRAGDIIFSACTTMALNSLRIPRWKPWQIYINNKNSICMNWGAQNVPYTLNLNPTKKDLDAAILKYLSNPTMFAPPIFGYYKHEKKTANDNHFILVIGGNNGNYRILDPWPDTAINNHKWTQKPMYCIVQYYKSRN